MHILAIVAVSLVPPVHLVRSCKRGTRIQRMHISVDHGPLTGEPLVQPMDLLKVRHPLRAELHHMGSHLLGNRLFLDGSKAVYRPEGVDDIAPPIAISAVKDPIKLLESLIIQKDGSLLCQHGL